MEKVEKDQDNPADRRKSTLDDVLSSIDEFGWYQKRLYLLVVLPVIFDSFTTMTSVFYLSEHRHRCAADVVINETYLPYGNQRTIVPDSTNNISFTYSECKITRNISLNANINESMTSEEPCSRWVYDKSMYEETVISDMNLVCEKQSFKSHGKMIFFFGYLIGGFAAGAFADLLGRRPVLSLCLSIMFVSNLINVWAPNFTFFIVCRFFYGMAVMGYFNTAIVIGLELVGPAKRKWTGFGIYFFWCVGELLLCGVAYMFRKWRWIQLAAAIPSGFFVAYYWIIPESPRWLLSRGRHAEAMAIFEKAAKINKRSLKKELINDLTIEKERPSTKAAVIALVKSPKMLLTSAVMGLNWFVSFVGYHGLSLNVGLLAGNVYLNFLIGVLVEVLAYSFCIISFDRIGRRGFHCFNLLVGGVACIGTILPTIVFPAAPYWIVVCLTMMGKLSMSAVFAQIFVFSTELYPTSVRTFALGSLNVVGTSGSIVAPYISDIASFIDTEFGKALPVIIFGSSMIIAGLLALLLPETLRTILPETIYEAESINRKSSVSAQEKKN